MLGKPTSTSDTAPSHGDLAQQLAVLESQLAAAARASQGVSGLSIDNLLRCVEAELFMVSHALEEGELADADEILGIARMRLRTVEMFMDSVGGVDP